jgi:hypothetical protein
VVIVVSDDYGWWGRGEGSGTSMWELVVLLQLLSMNFMDNNKNEHQLQKEMYFVLKEKCLLGRRIKLTP